MYSYQFNVSRMGHHVFRTDWQDRGQAQVTQDALVIAFGEREGYEIDVCRRSNLRNRTARIEDMG